MSTLTNSLIKLSLAALLVFLLPAAQAQSTDSTMKPGALTEKDAEGPLQIQYLGTGEGSVLFQIAYKNPGMNKFTVLVTDQLGNLLYDEAFKDAGLSIKFRLPAADQSRINFIIRQAKQPDITRSFTVRVNSHAVESYAVKKMNNR